MPYVTGFALEQDNIATARKLYIEVFEKGNVDFFDEIASPEFQDQDPTNPTDDFGGVKESMKMTLTAFPDIRVTIHDIFEAGDKVVVRFTYTGTHKGEFLGIKPTNKKIKVKGIDIIRFADGKAVEHWGEINGFSILQQMGIDGPTHGNK